MEVLNIKGKHNKVLKHNKVKSFDINRMRDMHGKHMSVEDLYHNIMTRKQNGLNWNKNNW